MFCLEMKFRPVNKNDGTPYGYRFNCPGCKTHHVIPTVGPKAWEFNGDVNRPTLSPSVLVYGRAEQSPRCHSFVKDGRIEFLSDSEHSLSGQTVDLEDVIE